MLPQFSTAGNFEPKFYTAGGMRFYLPLLHDIVAVEKPKLIVTLGLADAQAHLAFCQTAAQQSISSRCAAIRRVTVDEDAADDPGWQRAQKATAEFFPTISQLIDGGSTTEFSDGSVNVLLIDDVDSAETIRRELELWSPKLSSDALVMLHGLDLERTDPPRSAWSTFIREKAAAEFHNGIGLGIATKSAAMKASTLREAIFLNTAELAQDYEVVAGLIRARAQAKRAEHRTRMLEARQIWFDAVFADRTKAQEVMEHQQRLIANLEPQLAALHEDRTKAQLIMDSQLDQLQNFAAALEQSQAQLDKAKSLINVAKAACRKKGRCFDIRKEPKPKRTVAERVAREFTRTRRKVRRMLGAPEPAAEPKRKDEEPEERYRNWIAEHEPAPAGLEQQRADSATWERRPKISLLIPLFNTPAKFLEELFTSLVAQTYENWEACIIDGGSTESGTIDALRRWEKSDERIRLQRLEQNLGISENSNCALANARGDFIALVDHDDLLAPFALYQLAAAIVRDPEVDIFYSDEDRLNEAGVRARPFFKPEWSPELLYSCMYLGHLTAYRRDFVNDLGGFRKEFDLSQDYDLALRATERARGIKHIRHVLYHWREHAASGASGGKPEARKSNLAALADAMAQRGLDAEVLEYPTANRVRMRLKTRPPVSVIIPTDSPVRVEKCVRVLPQQTNYSKAEFVIVTNSALIHAVQSQVEPLPAEVRFVAFDQPFNFSAKCNAGAEKATGLRFIFLNDDVETDQSDWIENVIEPLENPDVGAVAPKLLYDTGRIQHAGLVTGVRDFPGTAFHQQAADTTVHANFAQSMRNVSALSGACLAMRHDDFRKLGGFDEQNTPISHSDVDLCFKVRAAGKRCVYTPFVTMKHAGHASMRAAPAAPFQPRDKSAIYLLKRWGKYITHDPFFTDNMRDWLFADSPTPIRMFARNQDPPFKSKWDLLFVSHDLSLSGAPLYLLHLAEWCWQNEFFVTIIAPGDGPLRQKITSAKIPLIIDPLVATGHESFGRFIRGFDLVLANSVRTPSAIPLARRENVPVAWYIHETDVGEHYLKRDGRVRAAVPLAKLIFAASERSLSVFRPYAVCPMRKLVSGCPDVRAQVTAERRDDNRVHFLMLGTVERRKGQDILLEAIRRMDPKLAREALFEVVGGGLDQDFISAFRESARSLSNLRWREGVEHDESLQLLANADVLVCASRDESLPLTLLEAMSLGKTIISTTVGGIPEYLTDGVDALLIPAEDAAALAAALERVVRNRAEARKLGTNARAVYETRHTQERFGRDFAALIMPLVSSAIPGD
jgi:GT2 family glycosyltransferase